LEESKGGKEGEQITREEVLNSEPVIQAPPITKRERRDLDEEEIIEDLPQEELQQELPDEPPSEAIPEPPSETIPVILHYASKVEEAYNSLTGNCFVFFFSIPHSLLS
jgi:hypothetical protein